MKIIAECAQGYYQKNKTDALFLAKLFVLAAKSACADAVKFQLVIADELCTPDYKHYKLSDCLDIGLSGWAEVVDYAKELDIEIMLDVFGSRSLQICCDLGVKTIKIHPTDFTNLDFLEEVANSSIIETVIAGSGGAKLSEIITATEILCPKKNIVLIHGFQGYPTALRDNSLQRLITLKDIAKNHDGMIQLGFADHADPTSSDATHLAAASISYGVSVFEKHLTLARCMQLEDYEAALDPDSFREYVEIVKRASRSHDQEWSKGDFKFSESESNYRGFVQRHVITAKALPNGTVISSSDLVLKRSSEQNPVLSKERVIGLRTRQDVPSNVAITLSMIENEKP